MSRQLAACAVVLFIMAGLFLVLGFTTAYTYGDSDSGNHTGHIVGGDAYNFQIIAIRGLQFSVVGLCLAVVGSALFVASRIQQPVVNEERPQQEATAPQPVGQQTTEI